MTHLHYNEWGALIVVPLLVLANMPLLSAAARREPDEWVGMLLLVAFGLKIIGSFARYVMAFYVYSGAADATGYTGYAQLQSTLWRRGFFVWEFPEGVSMVGTAFLKLVTTGVFTVTGPSIIAGYAVFAAFSYWGSYMCYRAFRIAFPDGRIRVYAAAVFLLPAFLFWPSGIGKEAFLMPCVGAVALGAARLYDRRPGAYTLIALGLVGSAMVRPHVTVLAAAALLAGQLFRPAGPDGAGRAGKAIGSVLLLVGAWIAISRASDFLGLAEVNSDSVRGVLDTASANTQQGGSQFDPIPVTSPISLPGAIVSVLFRPFPWESHNVQQLLVSLEGLLIFGAVIASWRGLVRVPRLLRTRPYLVFSLTYILLYVYAFSGFGNFGILARQRVLVFPFVLVFLALPRARAAQEPAPPRTEELNATV